MSLIISGNESGDLDSVAAAIGLAFLLKSVPRFRAQYKRIVPLVRAPRRKYHDDHIVTQTFMMAEVNIDQAIFCTPPGYPETDDGKQILADENNHFIVLDQNAVDHFTKPYWKSNRIVGVFDHHQEVEDNDKLICLDPELSEFYVNDGPVRASTCSLVSELLLWKLHADKIVEFEDKAGEELQSLQTCQKWTHVVTEPGSPMEHWKPMLTLMLAVLIEDSKGFEKALKDVRWTQNDRIVYKLITHALELSERDLFEFVFTVKDIQKGHKKALRKMTWEQLLVDDLKVYIYPGEKVFPVSSVRLDVDNARENSAHKIEKAVIAQMSLHQVGEMAMLTHSPDGRQLWMFCWRESEYTDHRIFDGAANQFADNIVDPQIEFKDVLCNVFQFDQTHTRKKVEPMLRALL